MIVINDQILDFTTKEGQKIKEAFLKKHNLTDGQINIELRRNPADFFMQENEKGEKRLSASASKGVSWRYWDKDNRQVAYVLNYTPAMGGEKAIHTRHTLKFYYTRPIVINDFDAAFYLLEHPDLQGSELNKIRKPKGEYLFYVYDPEKEATEKVNRQRAEAKAVMAVEDITSLEQLRVVARGFMIADTENKKEIILRDELNSIAKANPESFLAKMKTDQFKLTSLVYEAKEKGKIIYQPVDKSWYVQMDLGGKKELGEKIFTHNVMEKPEEALIVFLQSPRGQEWRKQLTDVLKTEAVA